MEGNKHTDTTEEEDDGSDSESDDDSDSDSEPSEHPGQGAKPRHSKMSNDSLSGLSGSQSNAYRELLQFLQLGCFGTPEQGYPAIVIVLSTIPPSVCKHVSWLYRITLIK